MPLRNLLTVLPMMFPLLQLQQVPAVLDVVATDAVFPSAQSTVMKLEITNVTVATITNGSESILGVNFQMSGMDLDLFYQGKSTGSGFSSLEAPEGNASRALDENGLAVSGCTPGSQLDPDRAASFPARATLEELQGFYVETAHGHFYRAWHELEPPQFFQFLWEVGMRNEFFGTCDGASTAVAPKLVRPAMVVLPDPAPWPTIVEKFHRLCTAPSFLQQVALSSEVATWQDMHDAKLGIALMHGDDVIVIFPASFQLVFQLSTLTSVAEPIAMMKDVMESRSRLALLKCLGAGKLSTAGLQQGVTTENWVAEWSSFRPMLEAFLSDGLPGFRPFQQSRSRMLHSMDSGRSKSSQSGRAAGAKHEAPSSGRLLEKGLARCWPSLGS